MHRTDGDAYGLDGLKHIYQAEVAGVHDATQMTFNDGNAFQEEIANVIEAEGIGLNTSAEAIADMHQLNDAINAKLRTYRMTNTSSLPGTTLDDVLESLDDDHVASNSSMEGATVKNQLDLLYMQRRGHITGCNYWNDSTNRHEFQFSDGSAVAYGGQYILQMPEVTGNYKKTIINNTGWTAGHNGNGLPSAIVCVPGTRLYIFLIRRQDESLDIGFDTDIAAANLWADGVCQTRRWRRIGYCQIESLDGDNCMAYICVGKGNYHLVGDGNGYSRGIKYTVAMSADFAYVVGNAQYLPNFDCRAIYVPIPPTGGDCQCLIVPRYLAGPTTDWMADDIYNCQFRDQGGLNLKISSGPQILPAHMSQPENGFIICVDNYSGITCSFRCLGFIDYRDGYC